MIRLRCDVCGEFQERGNAGFGVGAEHRLPARGDIASLESRLDSETRRHHVHVRSEQDRLAGWITVEAGNQVAAGVDAHLPAKARQFCAQQLRQLPFGTRGRVDSREADEGLDEAIAIRAGRRHLAMLAWRAKETQLLKEAHPIGNEPRLHNPAVGEAIDSDLVPGDCLAAGFERWHAWYFETIGECSGACPAAGHTIVFGQLVVQNRAEVRKARSQPFGLGFDTAGAGGRWYARTVADAVGREDLVGRGKIAATEHFLVQTTRLCFVVVNRHRRATVPRLWTDPPCDLPDR